MITCRHFNDEDYQAVCDFLIELNREGQKHINWNWARWEWMYGHPEFNKECIPSIGLWLDGERIVGAAIYDMYFGEGFCGALPEYESTFPEILDYAVRELGDENGFGFALCDGDSPWTDIACKAGFVRTRQSEHMMKIPLDRDLSPRLPEGFSLAELDPVKELEAFQWLLWQGFDHGGDRAEFERENEFPSGIAEFRRHFNPSLSVAAVDGSGNYAAYCCLWYDPRTDYAYVEPVCTVPAFRGKGLSRAVIYEALGRAKALGASSAYVNSDMDFYRRLGFQDDRHYSFYWKK